MLTEWSYEFEKDITEVANRLIGTVGRKDSSGVIFDGLFKACYKFNNSDTWRTDRNDRIHTRFSFDQLVNTYRPTWVRKLAERRNQIAELCEAGPEFLRVMKRLKRVRVSYEFTIEDFQHQTYSCLKFFSHAKPLRHACFAWSATCPTSFETRGHALAECRP